MSTEYVFRFSLFIRERGMLTAVSIYKTDEAKRRFYEIYDEKIKELPVAYEDIYLDTLYLVNETTWWEILKKQR